ncbi:MAG: hypothetical protein H0T46_24135 [Deltaproteobacteria bacterium]|nr:hypothetical protein [Deltaproteobacteria bacterium]
MRCLSLLLIAAACQSSAGAGGGGDDDGGGNTDARHDGPGGGSGGTTRPFDPAVTSVVIEIDYEANQQPYAGTIVGFGDIWDISQTNLDRLFAGKKPVMIPRAVADMQNIGAVADEELTVPELLAIASAHRDKHDTATQKTYYIVFLSGHFADAGGANPNVLGVNIGDTGVVVMFKDVVRGTGSVIDTNTPRYVEQSTIVHEIGHAVGLTDNGVAMKTPHKDPAHGPHCNNNKCVMYWLNEGASEARTFVLQNVLAPSTILWDAACLADVDALTGGP